MPDIATTADTDHAKLADLNAHYIRAVAQSDVAWFDANLSADFLNTNPDGTLIDRAAFLTQIGRPSAVPDLTCGDVLIRRFGDTAIIHARTRFTRADGAPGAGRYTDIWSRIGGRWLCVAAHVTRA